MQYLSRRVSSERRLSFPPIGWNSFLFFCLKPLLALSIGYFLTSDYPLSETALKSILRAFILTRYIRIGEGENGPQRGVQCVLEWVGGKVCGEDLGIAKSPGCEIPFGRRRRADQKYTSACAI